uniref:Coenzyme F420:L-glutamate ligase-like domain-containing protein n=1 Tax=Thermofilum pendens TaxID=2269 RepID=A0A7C1P2N2_THEPE
MVFHRGQGKLLRSGKPRHLRVRVLRRSFRYWLPGSNIAREIVSKYKGCLDDGSIIVVSEKAASVALGNIYDESLIKADPISRYFTRIISLNLWGRLLYRLLRHSENLLFQIVEEVPLEYLAVHKKLSIKYGGLLSFIKPYSEAGIDTTNLPYYYVSLPLKDADKIARELREEIARLVSRDVYVMLVDSDRTFKPKHLSALAISTRPSYVKGIIDLGGLGFILGRLFSKRFAEFPTPVAYDGYWLGLPLILKIARVAEKQLGHGLGITAVEMLKNLGKSSFSEVKWEDMCKIRHYPAVVVKIEWQRR